MSHSRRYDTHLFQAGLADIACIKIISVHDASQKTVHKCYYDNGRLVAVGDHAVTYDQSGRVSHIGELPVTYEENSDRIMYIGGLYVNYRMSDAGHHQLDHASCEEGFVQIEYHSQSIYDNHAQHAETRQDGYRYYHYLQRMSLFSSGKNEGNDYAHEASFLAYLKIICDNDAYWKKHTRVGDKPSGIKKILEVYKQYCSAPTYADASCLSAAHDFFSDLSAVRICGLIDAIRQVATDLHHAHIELIDYLFRGRELETNEFYGVLANVYPRDPFSYRKLKDKETYPEAVIPFLKQHFTSIFADHEVVTGYKV